MADSSAQPTTRSTFPPPPPWWRLYPPDPPPQFATTAAARTAAASDDTPSLQPLPTAFGLSIFEPPLPPATATTPYALFNQAYTVSPPPPPLPPNTPQLFDSHSDGRIDYAKQLSKLAASLLSYWLALLHTLATAQPNTAPLLAGLSHCYINITHLLARLRRHQAVQHVLLLTRGQLRKRRERRQRLQAEVAKCKALLARYGMEWAEDDKSVELRRRVDESKETEAGLKKEMEMGTQDPSSGVGVKEEVRKGKREGEVEDSGDGNATGIDEAADLQRASQLEALLSSIIDTGDY